MGRFLKLNSITATLIAVASAAALCGCQKVSVPRVSSKFGNVEAVSSNFVIHYLDTDPSTYTLSQAQLKQDASPGLVGTLKKAGVLCKNDKELKAKIAQLSKRKVAETVDIKEVKEGEVTPSGLIPVKVKGEKNSLPFSYVLGLGIRKDTSKLAVVTITKQ